MAARSAEVAGRVEFVVPGTLGPRLEARRNLLGNVQIYADGVKLPRRGLFRSTWTVTASDGTTHELRLGRSLTTTKVLVDGRELVIERPLARWELGLVLLPLALGALAGGFIGVAFGAVAGEVNRRIARTEAALPVRVTGMLVASAVATGLWYATALGVGLVVSPIPEYPAGSCYEGFREGDGLADGTMVRVDCARLHDAEVVANLEHPDASYPGPGALLEYGSSACTDRIPEYAGTPDVDPSLTLFVVYPEELLWLKGDRTIDCFMVAAAGAAPWSGSLGSPAP